MSFAATVGAWAAQTEKRIEATYKRSIEMLAEEMRTTKPQGGLVPFQTGNLARSLLASTSAMPSIGKAKEEFKGQDIGIVTATMSASQPVWIGYQAVYARRMNYGFVGSDVLGRTFNQSGNYFIESAIANWQEIVAKAANELQASVEARQ